MPQAELEKLLDELQQELAEGSSLDDDARAQLADLHASIGRLLAAGANETPANLAETVSGNIDRFETSHPALTMVLIGLWIYAVWRLTPVLDEPQAAAYGFSREGRLRLAVRWLQLGWVVAALSIPLGAVFSGYTFGFTFFLTLFFVGLGLGLLGLVCFVMFLRRFAGWVGDEFAEKAFYLAVWGNVIAIPLAILFFNILFGLGPFLIIVGPLFVLPIVVLLIVSLLAFPVGLLSLSRSVDWSVVHSRREAERARALREKMAPRPAPLPEPPAQIELAASPEHHSTPVDPVPEKDA